MQATLALIADGPPLRRRRKRGGPWILLGSAAAHLLVLGGLVAGVRVMPPLVEPPAISVELLSPAPPTEAMARPVQPKPAADTAGAGVAEIATASPRPPQRPQLHPWFPPLRPRPSPRRASRPAP